MQYSRNHPQGSPSVYPFRLVRTVIASKSLLYLARNSVIGNNCLEEKTSPVLSAQPNTTGVLHLLVGEAAGLDSDISRVTYGKERSQTRISPRRNLAGSSGISFIGV